MSDPVSENEPFVTLIRVAGEDPAIREKLFDILSQKPIQRGSVLNYYIEKIKREGAPEALISALGCLLDDAVAEKAMEVLAGKRT